MVIDRNSEHDCCWKAFHTDVNGKWFMPHKAGPITGCLLVIGWIIFLILFGWMVALALLLVLFLTLCACFVNFICTGNCRVDEDDEEEEEEVQAIRGAEGRRNTSPIYDYEGTT